MKNCSGDVAINVAFSSAHNDWWNWLLFPLETSKLVVYTASLLSIQSFLLKFSGVWSVHQNFPGIRKLRSKGVSLCHAFLLGFRLQGQLWVLSIFLTWSGLHNHCKMAWGYCWKYSILSSQLHNLGRKASTGKFSDLFRFFLPVLIQNSLYFSFGNPSLTAIYKNQILCFQNSMQNVGN